MHKARIMNLQHAMGRRNHNLSSLAGRASPPAHIEALPQENFFSLRDSKSQSQKRRHLLNRSQHLFTAAVATAGRTSPATTQKSSLGRIGINGHEYSQPLFPSTSKHKSNYQHKHNKDIEDLGIIQAKKSMEKKRLRDMRQSMDIMQINIDVL